MTNTTEDYAGELPDGWTGGQHLSKWWRGKIVHLYTLFRACAQCGGKMRIDVTKAALDGTAKNAGLHLKRCATCRAAAKALGTNSRPKVEGEATPRPAASRQDTIQPNDAEQLRTANATMKDELDGLYAQTKELRERLAKYELPAAMEAVANGAKMPWES